MANDMRYLSAEEEAKLLKPIDEYVGKIQAQIDALRVDGSDKVQALKTHISLTKEDKNYTKEDPKGSGASCKGKRGRKCK
jgi:methyl-galactoside transport system permease protein